MERIINLIESQDFEMCWMGLVLLSQNKSYIQGIKQTVKVLNPYHFIILEGRDLSLIEHVSNFRDEPRSRHLVIDVDIWL